MVDKFDMEKYAHFKPDEGPFFSALLRNNLTFIVTKKNVDFNAPTFLTLTGYFEGEEDRPEQQITIPHNSVEYLKNLKYRPR